MIENEIIKGKKVNFDHLLSYGFKEKNNRYEYEKSILDQHFLVSVTITKNGQLTGKIWDNHVNDEYTAFRIKDQNGEFAGHIREEYQQILQDIVNRCFNSNYFLYDQTNRLANKIIKQYGNKPEFLWKKNPGFGIFRNVVSKKWYAAFMNIDQNKLDPKKNGEVEILNVKLNSNKIKELGKKKVFYPAYHMNKKNWITILLNDTMNDELIMEYINESYLLSEK